MPFTDGSGVVRPVATYDANDDPRMTPEHFFVLQRIGGGVPLSHLGHLGVLSKITALVAELQAWGAVIVEPDPELEADVDMGQLSSEEKRMLGEPVDLTKGEKLRLLELRRALDRGRMLQVLGLSGGVDEEGLLAAYFALTKRYHPDRYRGRSTGSFGPLMGEVFALASQAVKALSDPRTTRSGRGWRQHRRHSVRYAFRGSVQVRCESWDASQELQTADLSRGGLFVCTERSAQLGESLTIKLQTKTGPLKLTGRVIWLRPASDDEELVPGLGVRLDELEEEDESLWQRIVERVEELQPVPEQELPPKGERPLANRSGVARVSPIVGIDFGTSYTSVSTSIDNRVRLLPWPSGELSIPSVVAFPARGRHVVGRAAKLRLMTDPDHTVASAKRFLGRRADDPVLQTHEAAVPYDLVAGPDGFVLTEMWGEQIHFAQICSYILSAARDAAEQAIERRVRQAVVAVPTSFGAQRIEVLRRAAQLAQLELVDILEEPTAAALANRSYPDFGELVGIYDFGGGTFDFSIVDASNGDFRVLATTGDSWLGGDDFDWSLAEASARLIEQRKAFDVRTRAAEWQQLLFACEKAKRELSTSPATSLEIADFFHGRGESRDLFLRITREQAEALWQEPIARSLATCDQALSLLGLGPSDLSQVYLSGGSSYMPAVQRAIAQKFQRPVRSLVPPEYAVCLGAGVHAATLERRRLKRARG